MKRTFCVICCFVMCAVLVFGLKYCTKSYAQQVLLKGYVQEVPESFYGTWRVVSNLVDTDTPGIFKQKGVDLWNLSLVNNVINLSNPFSGASAEINIEEADGNRVTFRKIGRYDNKILTDIVQISIDGDSFTGVDILKLETLSDVDGSVRKTENAKYSIKGERLAGQSVIGN